MIPATCAQLRVAEQARHEPPAAPIRVLVVERRPPVRLQVLRLLDMQPQLESVAAGEGTEAIARAHGMTGAGP